ncbi:MAG: hypothetical protein IKX24_07605 [Prevotella sp.]|nr:hypothetical protein [Prevotella sp.]
MKYWVLLLMVIFYTVALKAQNDSIKTETLPEVMVNADEQIEMADKTVLLPTSLERRHAANGFDLLGVMQPTEIEVSSRTRTITTHNGGEVALCINGMEALPEDIATLRAKNIRSIEYIRTPSGRYAGKAGLVNFITVKMDYGGNVYLSAREGFAYKMGDYLAFADWTRKGLTLSLTASCDWAHDHSYVEGHEDFSFADATTLARDFTGESSVRKGNNQAVRMKLTSVGNSHRLNAFMSLTRQALPTSDALVNAQYIGHFDGITQRIVSMDSRNFAPMAYVNYTRWLPKNQTLDLTASASFGHNTYHSLYSETSQPTMASDVTEDNRAIHGSTRYYKSWSNGITLSGSLTHDHHHYKDRYAGASMGEQRLSTDVTMGLMQLSGSSEKYFYYFSAGMSNSAVSLNGSHDDYCVPVAFYGANYAINAKHALALNGLFTHTLFDPSNKNAMTVPTSFFEATCGNPNLKPMKVLGNTLSYNGQSGKTRFSVSYDNNIYFDNILHRYSADHQTIFDTSINGGTFYGNMLSVTGSYHLFSDKLRLSATAIEEYNMLRGDIDDLSRNIIRMKASVTYLVGDWTMRFNYRSPYATLDIREPYLIRRRPVYEWQVGWNHKAWVVEALVHNPFDRYDKQHVTMDYGCYCRDTWGYHEPEGRLLNLTLTYSFGYGKKSERSDMDVNKTVNNAIMKTY